MKILVSLFLIVGVLFSQDKICKDYKIAIDIGHTPKRGGATSSKGVNEYYYNKKVAYELLEAFEKKGFKKTFLVNPDDLNIKLKQRTKIANKKKANIFISIHHDSVQEKYLKYKRIKGKRYHYSYNFSGHSIFYSTKNSMPKQSLEYAKLLGSQLVRKGLIPTHHHAEKIKGENRKLLDKKRGIYEFDMLYVLRTSNMPAILLELGIIVNPDQEKDLNKKEYRKLFIDSILSSVDLFSRDNLCK